MNKGASEPSNRDQLAPLAEERQVIERLQQGDRAAFNILYEWYGDTIYEDWGVGEKP